MTHHAKTFAIPVRWNAERGNLTYNPATGLTVLEIGDSRGGSNPMKVHDLGSCVGVVVEMPDQSALLFRGATTRIVRQRRVLPRSERPVTLNQRRPWSHQSKPR